MIADVRLDAQNAVLGSMLIDARCIPAVLGIVRAEDFSGVHRFLFEVIADSWRQAERAELIDPVTILSRAPEDGPIDHDNLRNFVVQLMEITPSAANAERYAALVKSQARVARVHDAAGEMLRVQELPALRRLLHQTAAAVADRDGAVTTTMAEALSKFYAKCDDGREWLPWLFAGQRDKLFLRQGDFVVLGAESSVGKTAFALQLALFWASKGKKVGFYSLETDDEDLTDRMLAGFLGVDMQILLRNKLTQDQFDGLAHISSELYKMPFTIINATGMTAEDIATQSLLGGFDIILIDYLQLVTPTTGNTREREVASISVALKNFGRSSGVTVVALSQLNRDKLEKTPSLDRLRDSSQVRNDADVVFLMSLAAPDAKKGDPEFGLRLLHIAKNKRGPQGKLMLKFDGPRQLFYPANENGPIPLFRLPGMEQMGF